MPEQIDRDLSHGGFQDQPVIADRRPGAYPARGRAAPDQPDRQRRHCATGQERHGYRGQYRGHTRHDGQRPPYPPVVDTECGEQSSYADEARLSLSDVDSTSMMGAYLDDERSYLALVSDVPLDIARVADAHTGSCSTYRMNSRTITTSRLDLPPAIATENATVLYEVSDPDNPDWADDEVFYGYASVDGYTIAAVSMNGVEFEGEFTEFFTNAVPKVRNR